MMAVYGSMDDIDDDEALTIHNVLMREPDPMPVLRRHLETPEVLEVIELAGRTGLYSRQVSALMEACEKPSAMLGKAMILATHTLIELRALARVVARDRELMRAAVEQLERGYRDADTPDLVARLREATR